MIFIERICPDAPENSSKAIIASRIEIDEHMWKSTHSYQFVRFLYRVKCIIITPPKMSKKLLTIRLFNFVLNAI
jgi:hypothetical protein